MSGRDRVISAATFAALEREAALYATREQREKRRKGRWKKKADRMADLRAWLIAQGIPTDEEGCHLQILHNGWRCAELEMGGGRRLHVRQSGAGFYVAVLGTGARGRLTPFEVKEVIDALRAPSGERGGGNG